MCVLSYISATPNFKSWIRPWYWYNNSLCDIFTYRNDFANAIGVQNRNLSIAIVLNYVRVAYVNLIATGIVFNIRASSSHIGRMVAFSEHRRWIISVFDWRSIMNRLYWHEQQVGYVCFIPFVWEQRGVIAMGPIRPRWFHTFCPCAEPLGDGHEGMSWCGRGLGAKDRSRWTGIRVIVARVIVALDCSHLRDLIAAIGLVILFKFGLKSSICRPMWPWNLMDDLEKQ